MSVEGDFLVPGCNFFRDFAARKCWKI